ncbi:hypothetical protein EI94DRAFT_1897679 [Lactarius quietus]|nr:hypothetical protein EI94DRAFT_1897679 [Lactarius quietus]
MSNSHQSHSTFLPFQTKTSFFVVAGTLGCLLPSSGRVWGLDVNSDNNFKPRRSIPFSSVTPNYLIFTCNDTRLVVSLTQGPVIVFDASAICSTGTNEVTPLHTFLLTTRTPTAVRQMYTNPGDIPELVALLRKPDGNLESQLIEVINVSTLQSLARWSSRGTPETFPASISWSPKGKQVAIALQSGDIITFSPTPMDCSAQCNSMGLLKQANNINTLADLVLPRFIPPLPQKTVLAYSHVCWKLTGKIWTASKQGPQVDCDKSAAASPASSISPQT